MESCLKLYSVGSEVVFAVLVRVCRELRWCIIPRVIVVIIPCFVGGVVMGVGFHSKHRFPTAVIAILIKRSLNQAVVEILDGIVPFRIIGETAVQNRGIPWHVLGKDGVWKAIPFFRGIRYHLDVW